MEEIGNHINDALKRKRLAIDPDKSQLLVSPKPATPTFIHIEGSAITCADNATYLGTIFQPKKGNNNPFQKNALMRAARAVVAAGCGIRLMKSVGRVSPQAMRSYMKTIVLPAFTYSSETWYTGTTRGIADPPDKVL